MSAYYAQWDSDDLDSWQGKDYVDHDDDHDDCHDDSDDEDEQEDEGCSCSMGCNDCLGVSW